MATSTEATVNAALVGAIQGIYSSLGFDASPGNVKAYPIEFEREEENTSYLMSTCSSTKVVRCWSVDVRANDAFFAVDNVANREYQIDILGYYEIGVNGSGYSLLVDHSRKVRKAIIDLGTSLSGTVDWTEAGTPLDIAKESAFDVSKGEILIGAISYTALKRNPDY